MKETTIINPVNTIIELTYRMEKKEKFAFVNISRSALSSLLPDAEKKPPKYFLKSIAKCIETNDENFLKAVPSEYSIDIENGKYATLGIEKNSKLYDANMFDYYCANRKEVVDIFVNHYIKDSKNVILSFHDQKTVQKVFGQNQIIVTVPYNNYYDKLDAIVDQLSEYDGIVDCVILDCPLLATAIAPKIWEKLTMSIIDFGKVVSSSRFQATSAEKDRPARSYSKDRPAKNFNSKRNEKR